VEYWLTGDTNYSFALPRKVTNALGHTTSATYDYRSGLALTTTNVNGGMATSTYDTWDRLSQYRAVSGATTNYSYTLTPPLKVTVTDPYGRVTEQQLDNHGRPTQQTTQGQPGQPNIVKHSFYDAGGRMQQSGTPYLWGAPEYKTGYEYDPLGRPTRVDLPVAGNAVAYAYGTSASGYTTQITNPDGRRRQCTYREDGNLIEVTEGDAANNLTIRTYYSYDAVGRLLQIALGQSNPQTRSFTYDTLGRLRTETHPESGTTTYN
jgi:YD repeat-containing protein